MDLPLSYLYVSHVLALHGLYFDIVFAKHQINPFDIRRVVSLK